MSLYVNYFSNWIKLIIFSLKNKIILESYKLVFVPPQKLWNKLFQVCSLSLSTFLPTSTVPASANLSNYIRQCHLSHFQQNNLSVRNHWIIESFDFNWTIAQVSVNGCRKSYTVLVNSPNVDYCCIFTVKSCQKKNVTYLLMLVWQMKQHHLSLRPS